MAGETLRPGLSTVAQPGFIFDSQHNRFLLPETDVFSLPEVCFLFEVLKKRPLWQSSHQDLILLADLRYNQSAIEQDGLWQTQLSADQIRQQKEKFSTILIITESLNSETLPAFGQRLEKAAHFLPGHRGSIFILEEQGEDNDPKSRKKLLQGAGFVKTNILKPKDPSYLLWEGRKPKEHRGIDLTKNPDFWQTLKIVCRRYQQSGFEPVVVNRETGAITKLTDQQTDLGWPEVAERCRSAKNPPDAVNRLIAGFGLTVLKTDCGRCLWQIDYQGTETKIGDCGDPDCDNQTPTQVLKPAYEYKIGTAVSDAVCFHCGNITTQDHDYYIDGPRLTRQTTVIKHHLFRSKIHVEYHCPHCGWSQPKKLWVLNAQIEF